MSWNSVAASVIGSSHLDQQKPCQDACVLTRFPLQLEGEALLAVVSDGAGSAELSQRGSQLACESVMEVVSTFLGTDPAPVLSERLAESCLHRVREALAVEAELTGHPLSAFACTLLGALILPDQSLYFQIGDGAIVVRTESAAGVVFWPEEGLYANMTYFVTGTEAAEHFHVHLDREIPQQLGLFSDGLQRLALDMRLQTVHLPFFDPMWKLLSGPVPDQQETWKRGLEQFLAGAAVNARTDDDKTLILASASPCPQS